jgi:hypothetical protein
MDNAVAMLSAGRPTPGSDERMDFLWMGRGLKGEKSGEIYPLVMSK